MPQQVPEQTRRSIARRKDAKKNRAEAGAPFPRRCTSYVDATKHPVACVLFVLPLLLLYELGVLCAGNAQQIQSGADTWLRSRLFHLGFTAHTATANAAAPLLVAAILLLWSLTRFRDRPRDYLNVWTGMLVESALFALGLYVFSQACLPLLDRVQVYLQAGPGGTSEDIALDPAIARVLSYLGVGIYEETIFRLVLFLGLCRVFQLMELSPALGLNLAAIVSALAFAGAHHIGASGEAFHGVVFAFRTTAGLYFAYLCHFRGFGITVGAHTGYDLLVGLLLS